MQQVRGLIQVRLMGRKDHGDAALHVAINHLCCLIISEFV